MPEVADVVVIGAGIHGASTAFHLARRGMHVTILDAHGAASGATGRSSGLVRMHYDLAAESALAWRSFGYFSNWAELVGSGDSGFVRTGFLRIVPPDQADALRANVADQVAIGIPTCVISADEVGELAPALTRADFEIAAYEPQSGYADPTGACTGFLGAARARGAVLHQRRPAQSIDVRAGRVVGVRTAGGSIVAPWVVLAAGAWSSAIAGTAGIRLDVRAWHHDTGFLTRPNGFKGPLPTVIDDINELYFRPEGASLALVGLEDGNRIDDHAGDDGASDPAFVDHLAHRLCQRLPAFADAGFHSSHGGTDGISPDQRPILGRSEIDGLILQCGMSGTGFKIAPAVGLGISELIVDGRATSVDIAPFDPDRFAAGKPLRGDHPYGELWR